MTSGKSQVLLCLLQGIVLIPLTMSEEKIQAIRLTCHSSHMNVFIDLRYLQWLNPGSLHLLDPSCGPKHYNKTEATFRVPLEGCGTKYKSHNRLLVYSNVLGNSEKNVSREGTDEISRVPLVWVPFRCHYRVRYYIKLASGAGKREYARPERHPKRKDLSRSETNDQRRYSGTGKVQCEAIVWMSAMITLLLHWRW